MSTATTTNLHKEMHMFFSTIGDDGSRQVPAVSAILAAVLQNVIFILVKAKISNGKIKGLAILV